MRNFSTEGIVLKRMTSGEHDQCIVLFSPVLGKITAYARGARKINSMFSGHLEPFNICDFELYRSARAFTITQCRSKETFRPVRADLKKTLSASLALEVFEKTARSHEQTIELFNLIKTVFTAIGKSKKTDLIVESFKIKLMNINGILPDLKKCTSCGDKASEENDFTLAEDGRVFCAACRNPKYGCSPTPLGIIKLINYISLCDFEAIEKIAVSKDEASLLKNATGIFLGNYLERAISCENVIQRMC